MIAPTPTPAPKVKYPSLLIVPYAYAFSLVVLASVQLVGFGGLSFGNFNYETPGAPSLILLLAILEIFALPFALRLQLSRLARFLSASAAFFAPLVMFGSLIALDAATENASSADVIMSMGYVGLGLASFWVLDGAAALRLGRRGKA